jgi:hypothetical protein
MLRAALLSAFVALSGVLVITSSCAQAGTIADVAVTVAGDVCKLISQDDPNAPTWAQVACSVEGVAGPVIVSLPWSSWTAAQGQTAAQVKAKAMVKVTK